MVLSLSVTALKTLGVSTVMKACQPKAGKFLKSYDLLDT